MGWHTFATVGAFGFPYDDLGAPFAPLPRVGTWPSAMPVGHALACPCGASPWPILRSTRQPCRNRILFDICRNPLELPLISYPVIVGFMLPEGSARSPQI